MLKRYITHQKAIFQLTAFFLLALSNSIYFFEYNHAATAETQGTVPMIPTEPAMARISSIATKSVFTSWVKETP